MNPPVVFLGPSLGRSEALDLLDADIRPPAAQGDLGRAVSTRPAAIVLIDGVYERIASVSHKEILWALQEGIAVYGAASMGALRAAELDTFGMTGIGHVYEQLRDGTITSDDAVAVAHLGAEHGHRPTSVALVDIDATLTRAGCAGIIGTDERDILVASAAALFYAERSWPAVLGAARRTGLTPVTIDRLRAWLPDQHQSLKSADARAVLARTADDLAGGPVAPEVEGWTLARTVHWRRLYDAVVDPTGGAGEASNAELRDVVRLDGAYVETFQRALLQRLATAIAPLDGFEPDPAESVAELRRQLDLSDEAAFERWLHANDLDPAACERLACAQAAVDWAHERFREDVERDVADVLRIRGRYPATKVAARRRRAAWREHGLEHAAVTDLAVTDDELLNWLDHNARTPDKTRDIDGHARHLGFDDADSLRLALARARVADAP